MAVVTACVVEDRAVQGRTDYVAKARDPTLSAIEIDAPHEAAAAHRGHAVYANVLAIRAGGANRFGDVVPTENRPSVPAAAVKPWVAASEELKGTRVCRGAARVRQNVLSA